MTRGQTLAITAQATWPLHDTSHTQALETQAQAQLPKHQLMQRAGLAVARLAMALAPHAHTIWIACGPGNNGGDGLEAAVWLKQWGKHPVVTWLQHPHTRQQTLPMPPSWRKPRKSHLRTNRLRTTNWPLMPCLASAHSAHQKVKWRNGLSSYSTAHAPSCA